MRHINTFMDICRNFVRKSCISVTTSDHIITHLNQEASELVLWNPFHGDVSRGKRAHAYMDNLIANTGVDVEDVIVDQEV